MSAMHDLGPFLTHRWALRRTIDLRHSSQQATLVGQADWTPQTDWTPDADADDPSALRYREGGVLRIGGAELACSRTLRFDLTCADDPAGGADVFFDDGRFFYQLRLVNGSCQVIHRCGADLYEGVIEITGDDEFHERWDVTGPNKDYTSITVLRRVVDD